MKEEIKLLKKLSRLNQDQAYPGCGYIADFIIDLETNETWVDGYKKDLKKAIGTLSKNVAYMALGSNLATKGSWLIDQHLDDCEKFINADYDDFYIDNINIVKLYFALNSAIVNNKNKKKFVFAFMCGDDEMIDCKVFNNLQEIKDYCREYWNIE